MIGVYGLIGIGQRLRLDPLRGVDDKKRPLDRLHGAADLIPEIHVPRSVYQVQDVCLTVRCRILDANRVGLDRDAAFALNVHGVEDLLLHVPLRHRARHLNEPVGKRRLPVVDMGDDREIADMRQVSHCRDMRQAASVGKTRLRW